MFDAKSRSGRPLKIDAANVPADDPRAEIDRLLPHQVKQFRPLDAMPVVGRHFQAFVCRNGRIEVGAQVACRKAGIVFHFRGQRQLPQRQRARHLVFRRVGPFKHQGLQFRTSGVNGGRPSRRAAADDNEFLDHDLSFPIWQFSLRHSASQRAVGTLYVHAARPRSGHTLRFHAERGNEMGLLYAR